MTRLVLIASLLIACHTGKSAELRVLGVDNDTGAQASHVFVQVTNPAGRPMRLTKLEYVFASAANGATVSEGELELYREVPAGSAVVVEVPLDADADTDHTLTLRGKLTTELDQIVRIFNVDAQIQPR